jgi:hypothetical protein
LVILYYLIGEAAGSLGSRCQIADVNINDYSAVKFGGAIDRLFDRYLAAGLLFLSPPFSFIRKIQGMIKTRSKFLLSILVLGVLFLNCERQKTRAEIDREVILEYIQENNLDAVEHDSGMFYIIEDPGTGDDFPRRTAIVEVRYKGYFTDGFVFEETLNNNTAELRLSQTVTGWQIGVPLLKKGGRGTFILPSGLGYGFFGSGPVPPNTVIIFDIELINFSG